MVKKTYPLKSRLQSAKVEKDVENTFRECFSSFYGPDNIQITSPYGSDGYLTKRNSQLLFDLPEVGYRQGSIQRLKLLLEFKFDKNYKDSIEVAKTILQCLFYIKRFEMDGNDIEIPNIIFIGDINEMFVIHFNKIQKFLDEDINWNVAPSSAAENYPELVNKISLDPEVNPHILAVTNDSFKEIISYIESLNDQTQPHIRINEHNIGRIFDDFVQNIINKKEIHSINPETLVGIFIGCITNPEDYYLHPKKRNTLVTPTHEVVKVNSSRFTSFFKYFQGENYTIEEKRKFTEIQDRLIEDLARRKSGEFFTPTIWADESIRILDNSIGENWKSEYLVWDCASGTKNLTRDHSFSNIYNSTLHKSDIDVSADYNSNGKAFQYDFLNDGIDELGINHLDDKLPESLRKSIIEKGSIVFFMNPPYGTATADGAKGDGAQKKGMSLTNMNLLMNEKNYGYSSQQLYTQFLARIIDLVAKENLINVKIALYAPPTFLSSGAFKPFREKFLSVFQFITGILFSANHFADVSKNWGISFTVWESSLNPVNPENFTLNLKDQKDGEIIDCGFKTIYNTDNKISGSSWTKGDFQKKYGRQVIDFPQFSSAVNIKQNGRGKFIKGALGFYNNGGNNVYQSEGQVGIYSGPFSNGNGYAIMPEYFDNVIANFIARRFGFSQENWTNQKDEFVAPNEEHPKYGQFLTDALILTIFNPKAKVSSLRNIRYKGDVYNTVNNFFFMSINEMAELANKYGNSELYNDTINFPNERFVFEKLQTSNLGIEARNILNHAIKLTTESFEFRDQLTAEFPEFDINCWDAGWFQIKFIIGRINPIELSLFEKNYLEFFNSRRDLVYELGFLYK